MGGGIRLGEMERDSLLAHGASFLLNDRLMNCSDAHRVRVTLYCHHFSNLTSFSCQSLVCGSCGSVLSPMVEKKGSKLGCGAVCRMCGDRARMQLIDLPFVFRYLANELSAMNIRLTLDVKVRAM